MIIIIIIEGIISAFVEVQKEDVYLGLHHD